MLTLMLMLMLMPTLNTVEKSTSGRRPATKTAGFTFGGHHYAFVASMILDPACRAVMELEQADVSSDDRRTTLDGGGGKGKQSQNWEKIYAVANDRRSFFFNDFTSLGGDELEESGSAMSDGDKEFAEEELRKLDPQLATWDNHHHLKAAFTKFNNQLSGIKANLDSSGSNVAGKTRQQKCFYFTGKTTKDIGMYYYFLCLDDPGFDVRSLVTNFSATLDYASDGCDSDASKDSGILTRKEKAKMQFIASSLTSSFATSRKKTADGEGRPPLAPTKRCKIETTNQLIQTVKNDSDTHLLFEENKERIKAMCNKMMEKELDELEKLCS